jgi:RimJ/RimL family protein N-acetyltransferase
MSPRRTGANAETKLLLLRHPFEVLGCRRVDFYADERNERALAARVAVRVT